MADDGPQRPIVKKILQKYHEVGKHGRPGNTSEPLEVIIRFSLVHVLDINLSQQVFDFVGWVQLVSNVASNTSNQIKPFRLDYT